MKKKFFAYLAIFLFLCGAVLTITSLHKEVILVVNGERQTFTTYQLNVAGFLAERGITLAEKDHLTPSPNHWLREGETIQLEQAMKIFVFMDEEEYTLVTSFRKPANILSLANVPLYPEDRLYLDGERYDPEEPIPYRAAHSLQVVRSTPITLSVNGQSRRFTSGAETLAEALWNEGIQLYGRDHLSPDPNTPLTGTPIKAELTRSQELTIHLPEQTVTTRSAAPTIGEALAEAGMALQGLDYSQPAENSPLPEDGQIHIFRVREEIILEHEAIPFGSVFQATNELEIDTQQVLDVGQYGIKARRVRVRYENGEEVFREVEKEWTAKEPQPRVLGYGTKITVRSVNTPNGPVEYWRKITAYATSYSPCRSGVDECLYGTSSGKTVQKGVVGVIRSWYLAMQGQQVYIPGYGFATIEDVGGGISGRHWVDLGYSDDDWVPWSQYVTVYFLTPVPPADSIMWVLE